VSLWKRGKLATEDLPEDLKLRAEKKEAETK
jgi:hypothetical protein